MFEAREVIVAHVPAPVLEKPKSPAIVGFPIVMEVVRLFVSVSVFEGEVLVTASLPKFTALGVKV